VTRQYIDPETGLVIDQRLARTLEDENAVFFYEHGVGKVVLQTEKDYSAEQENARNNGR
jgi:hypothetical protein